MNKENSQATRDTSKTNVIASDAVESFQPDGVAELDLYQKREKIYTRKIEGYFQRLRLYTGWPLLLGYFLLPWLNWDGRQAVLFDLPARQFHILSTTFWPQDFPFLAGLLIISAFALFAVTSWVGRVWCGYTCPQTVWTAIFMWAEQLCEGSRNQRIKRDKGPLTKDKFFRKTIKHTMWLCFALLTGLTFVGYFSRIKELTPELLSISFGQWLLHPWEAFSIGFFTFATYINAGWLREQVCMYMCPYARFQSAMFDANTLVVSYDSKRGDPRGSRKKGKKNADTKLGDCIDCQVCVQVCPTGIDIRDGLQYQCINCALCIDGCNSIMDQMSYDKNLISYTTLNTLEGKATPRFPVKRMAYGLTLALMCIVFLTALSFRTPLELDVTRNRQQLYTTSTDGLIENNYTLKIINMDKDPHTFNVSVSPSELFKIVGATEITLEPSEVNELPLRLQTRIEDISAPVTAVTYTIEAIDDQQLKAKTESRFIGPSSFGQPKATTP